MLRAVRQGKGEALARLLDRGNRALVVPNRRVLLELALRDGQQVARVRAVPGQEPVRRRGDGIAGLLGVDDEGGQPGAAGHEGRAHASGATPDDGEVQQVRGVGGGWVACCGVHVRSTDRESVAFPAPL